MSNPAPTATPSITRGLYDFDYGDSVGMTPIVKMHTLGHDFCVQQLGLDPERLADPSFDLLSALGFSDDEIEAANAWAW